MGTGAHIRCMGKGRKERATPLRKDCQAALSTWLSECSWDQSKPLFVSNRGDRLSRDAVERIVRKYVDLASIKCPTLKGKRVTPHVLRHTAAMQLLQNGVDHTVIALWLGPNQWKPPKFNPCRYRHKTHAAHERVQNGLKAGQDPFQEIVAELSAQALCHLVGRKTDQTFGNSYQYIERYARKAKMTPHGACLKVLRRTEKVRNLILKKKDHQSPPMPQAAGSAVHGLSAAGGTV